MRQGLSEPEFYGVLVYKLKKIVGSNIFSAQFIKSFPIIKRLALTLMDFRLYDGSDLKTYLLMRWWVPEALAVVRPIGVYLLDFLCSSIQFDLLLSSYLCFISFLYLDLYVLGDYAMTS